MSGFLSFSVLVFFMVILIIDNKELIGVWELIFVKRLVYIIYNI